MEENNLITQERFIQLTDIEQSKLDTNIEQAKNICNSNLSQMDRVTKYYVSTLPISEQEKFNEDKGYPEVSGQDQDNVGDTSDSSFFDLD